MVKKYGIPFTVYSTVLWASTGFVIYGVIESGLVGGSSAIDVLRFIRLDLIFDIESMSPELGNLALAIALNECLEIVRLPFVVATTPIVVSRWRRLRGME